MISIIDAFRWDLQLGMGSPILITCYNFGEQHDCIQL